MEQNSGEPGSPKRPREEDDDPEYLCEKIDLMGDDPFGLEDWVSGGLEFNKEASRNTPRIAADRESHELAEEVNAVDLEGYEICPFCDIGTMVDPESELFLCLNPTCFTESCRLCKKLSHVPLSCEVSEEVDVLSRNMIEDMMSEALIRTCWQCQNRFIKEGEGNHMVCDCGAEMCYVCSAPIEGLYHFSRPEGGDNKCPFYGKDDNSAMESVMSQPLLAAKNPSTKLGGTYGTRMEIAPSSSGSGSSMELMPSSSGCGTSMDFDEILDQSHSKISKLITYRFVFTVDITALPLRKFIFLVKTEGKNAIRKAFARADAARVNVLGDLRTEKIFRNMFNQLEAAFANIGDAAIARAVERETVLVMSRSAEEVSVKIQLSPQKM